MEAIMRRLGLAFAAMLAAPLVGAGCSDLTDDSVGSQDNFALGDALPGTNATTFAAAKANFMATETQQDGLGPIFNERSCSACHSNSAAGGAGENVEQRFGRTANGVFDPLANEGGSLRQLFGIGGFNPRPGLNCQSGSDNNPPANANVFAGRVTTPLFGLGLVDSLRDSVFDTLRSREPAAIQGIVNRVQVVLPNPAGTGDNTVGRFGWKAGVPNLGQFAADAYLNEMGISTSSCINGTPNRFFGTENRANRAPSNAPDANGCPDDLVPGTDDDFATEENNCAGGLNELQDDVRNFTFFMAHLAAPPQVAIASGSAADRGRTLFNSTNLQCSGCHRDDAEFVSTSRGGITAGIRFHPFSDFLLHNMGTLGDGIGGAAGDRDTVDGSSPGVTRNMRTAPLWGLRFRNKLMHDGRTTDRAAAIRAHDGGTFGQGTGAARAFNALSASQQSDLLTYLNTL
jgi:CxxC motif-containing protein (DUF1111 family)